jgi:DNA-binding MltR family transcriptional regulator
MAINPDTGQRMGREAILTRVKALSKVRVKAVDVDAHIARMKSESDRGVMILAATLVEDALLTVLERTVKCPNGEMRNAIFTNDGPLASFSRRIDFALALGAITKNYHQSINTIRFIRNAAAHSHVDVDFSTPEVKWALGTMLRQEQADDFETWPRLNVRNFYLQCCGMYADGIIGTVGGGDSINGFYRAIKASNLDAPSPSQSK